MDRREKDLLLLRRIKLSPEGPDFLDYLERQVQENYGALLRARPEQNEMHKGIGLAYGSLLEAFERCDTNKDLKDVVNIWS